MHETTTRQCPMWWQRFFQGKGADKIDRVPQNIHFVGDPCTIILTVFSASRVHLTCSSSTGLGGQNEASPTPSLSPPPIPPVLPRIGFFGSSTAQFALFLFRMVYYLARFYDFQLPDRPWSRPWFTASPPPLPVPTLIFFVAHGDRGDDLCLPNVSCLIFFFLPRNKNGWNDSINSRQHAISTLWNPMPKKKKCKHRPNTFCKKQDIKKIY